MKLKTRLTILVIGLCTTCTINAQQSNSHSPWSFGAKLGINLYEYDNAREGNLNLGGIVEYDLKNRFFLRSGLDLSLKRAKNSDTGGILYFYVLNESGSTLYPSEPGDYRYYDRYASNNNIFLQLPITAGYRLPVSNAVNITFNAGVYTAVGLYSSGTYSIWERKYTITPEGEVINKVDEDFQDSIDGAGKFDFGIVGGIGVEYRQVALNVNYEYGLIDQTSKAYRDKDGIDLKNRAFAISLAYKF